LTTLQRFLLAVFSLVAVSCGATRVKPPPAKPNAPLEQGLIASAASTPAPAGLRVQILLPERADYVASSLGAKQPRVLIRIGNGGATSARVAPLVATFEAKRDGVSLRCAEHADPPIGVREAGELAPGQETSVARELDCAMPLPGTYEITATVRVGSGEQTWTSRRALTIAATGPVPRVVPGTALHVLITGPRATRAMPPDAWARPENAAVVAFINGGPTPLALGQVKLGFSVFKRGTDIPCAGQTEPVALPAALPGFGIVVARAPITCAPSEQGDYLIVGRLQTEQHPEEVDIGRFALRVTQNPLLFAPEFVNP
jgi:hypothetical protein